MRRLLVMVLTLALGLTTLAAAPTAAGTRDDDQACTVVQTPQGPRCLTQDEIRQRGFDGRTERQRENRGGGPGDDDHDRDHDHDRDRDRDRDYGRDLERWWGWWFDYWGDRSVGSCDCLSTWDTRRLQDIANGASPRKAWLILSYLRDHGCLTEREFVSLQKDIRDLDRSDLLAIIRDADRCDCGNGSHYWLRDQDLRWIDRWTGLGNRSIRQILGLRNGRDCVSRGDLGRLGRTISDRGYWDDFTFLDWL